MKTNEWLNPLYWIGVLACRCGLHDWEIFALVTIAKHKPNRILDGTHGRWCLRCRKEQILAKPIKYHPTRYEWQDKPKEQT